MKRAEVNLPINSGGSWNVGFKAQLNLNFKLAKYIPGEHTHKKRCFVSNIVFPNLFGRIIEIIFQELTRNTW